MGVGLITKVLYNFAKMKTEMLLNKFRQFNYSNVRLDNSKCHKKLFCIRKCHGCFYKPLSLINAYAFLESKPKRNLPYSNVIFENVICDTPGRRCSPFGASSSIILKRQLSNICYGYDDGQQESSDLYQRSIGAYNSIRKIIKHNLMDQEKRVRLDPTKEVKISFISSSNMSMFSAGCPSQDPTFRNLSKREYSNMISRINSTANTLTESSINEIKTCAGSLKYQYSTDSAQGNCPRCKKSVQECKCKRKASISKYGKLVPDDHRKIPGGCGKHDPIETSCGLVSEKPRKPSCGSKGGMQFKLPAPVTPATPPPTSSTDLCPVAVNPYRSSPVVVPDTDYQFIW